MRLMRVGHAGKERPALLDATGQLRDFSAHCQDIGGTTLLPAGLAVLRAPSTLPLCRCWTRPCASAPALEAYARSSVSASITLTTRLSPTCRYRPSQRCS